MYLSLKGYIISSRKIHEADREYVVYTDKMGKILVYAQGIRKATSKLASSMQHFALLDFSLYAGRRTRLLGCEIENLFDIRTEERISYGFYILELVDKISAFQSPNPGIYSLLKDVFEKIEVASVDGLKYIRLVSVLKILAYSGYSIVNKYKDEENRKKISYLINTDIDFLWKQRDVLRKKINFKDVFDMSQKVLDDVLETKIMSDKYLMSI